jgi:hypothetical protein
VVVLFCFVDIGRIVDDHSLTFLFIIMSPLGTKGDILF